MGVAAQGKHRRMLEEEKNIREAAFGDERGDFRLEAEGFAVVHAAEIEGVEHCTLIVARMAADISLGIS